MKQITFANQWGYPDIHITREFCKKFIQIRSESHKKDTYDFFCFKDPDLLIDVCPIKISNAEWDSTKIFFEKGDRIIINAHHSFASKLLNENEKNRFNLTYKLFDYLFQEILKTKIPAKENFIPSIDYGSFCCILPVYLNEKKLEDKHCVLVDNSFSEYDFGDSVEYSNLIKNLAKKHKNSIIFITENDKDLESLDNVISLKKVFPFFSNTNETSWLSRQCNVIIGKTKDYFSASLVKENINDPNKTFINIIEDEEDILIPESLFKAKFLKVNQSEVKNINEIL